MGSAEIGHTQYIRFHKKFIRCHILKMNMGRIKTQMVKRISHELLEVRGDQFKSSFEENKKLVEKTSDISSKKIRNIIAGYITRLVKKKEITV